MVILSLSPKKEEIFCTCSWTYTSSCQVIYIFFSTCLQTYCLICSNTIQIGLWLSIWNLIIYMLIYSYFSSTTIWHLIFWVTDQGHREWNPPSTDCPEHQPCLIGNAARQLDGCSNSRIRNLRKSLGKTHPGTFTADPLQTVKLSWKITTPCASGGQILEVDLRLSQGWSQAPGHHFASPFEEAKRLPTVSPDPKQPLHIRSCSCS